MQGQGTPAGPQVPAPPPPPRQRARHPGEVLQPARGPVVRDLRAAGRPPAQAADWPRGRVAAASADPGERAGGGRLGADPPDAEPPDGTPVEPAGCPGPAAVGELRYAAGDLLVVSGLPGSGKSTLIRRVVVGRDAQGGPVLRVDSQDARDRWERRVPPWLGYPVYRPLVRLTHYAGLRRAVRSGHSVVVHDCGTVPWVRRWLARRARRRGVALHLVLLDVPPRVALAGQAARGREVSSYAFGRHRAAVDRLRAQALTGSPPAGCATAVLLDRAAAGALVAIGFD